MLAGTDLKDENGVFLEGIIKKVYWPTSKKGNIHFNAQQDLASFLFGTSVEYVSTLLQMHQKYIHTKLTYIYAAHSFPRKSPYLLLQRKGVCEHDL